jgi:RNA polymerase sigma-70 factor (ECF subfamily)
MQNLNKHQKEHEQPNQIEHMPIDEFEKMALLHINSLYAAAMSLTKNAADAEDLVQDTYLRAFRYYEKFKADTNMRAWLHRILTNLFINNYRRKKVRKESDYIDNVEDWQLAGEAEHTSSGLPSAEAEAIAKLTDSEVKQAMQSLSEAQRLVVYYVDVEGFSYNEVAELLGIPAGTVMSRLHRARATLRHHLDEYARENGYISGTKNKKTGAKVST